MNIFGGVWASPSGSEYSSKTWGVRGSHIDERYKRITQNNESFPVGLPGGPAIQFGGFQEHFSGPR